MPVHGGARRATRVVALSVVWAVAVVTGLAVAPPPGPAAGADRVAERAGEVALRQARTFALHQLARTDARLAPGRFPTVAPGRSWHTSDTRGWLAGFWPGRLWLAYQLAGDPAWARRAARRQAPLAVRQDDASTHDLGFLLQTSFGQGARLRRSAARAEADAAVTRRAAAALASRWVPQAAALRSWDGPDGQVTVIVDSLVNLELLFAAARGGGEDRWRDLAHAHALTVAREHVRPDGSTVHVVRFDEQSGQPVWRGTRQGLSDASTWARGQSWAVYGFTGAWRDTGDPRLLAAARATADFALAHLPGDGVPFWDYDAPGTADTTRDTTAAAALAAGLLELARLDPDPARRATYTRQGGRVLASLAGSPYLARGTRSPAVLRHGHHSPTYPDSGVTYGDYYVLEALQRAQLLPAGTPALAARTTRPAAGTLRADLRTVRRVSAVSVRWRQGAARATRFRVAVSTDGRSWVVAREGVSSGRVSGFETYDLTDRRARFVRVTALGGGTVAEVRVRG